jgi:hypothetical protein
MVMSRSVLSLVRRTPLARNANSPPRSVVPSGRVIDGTPVILPTTTISRAAALTAPACSDAVVTVVGGSAIVQF